MAAAIFALAAHRKNDLLPISFPLIVYVPLSISISLSSISRFTLIAVLNISVFFISWVLFFVTGDKHLINKIRSQMFPFKRDLLNASWLLSFWPFSAVMDKRLTQIGIFL